LVTIEYKLVIDGGHGNNSKDRDSQLQIHPPVELASFPGINCLIGPGDSGKSTVLDAIDLCLCARRSAPITDADFYDLNVANPISITLTLGGLDEGMKSVEAYGDYLRGYRPETGIIEDEPGQWH
jgi:hypothetical protein